MPSSCFLSLAKGTESSTWSGGGATLMVVDRVAAKRGCAERLACVHLLSVLERLGVLERLPCRQQLGLIRVLVAKQPERLGAV